VRSPGVVWRKLVGPVIASSAVTTGLFVLAGVVVGGLVTGGVNYALERRLEQTAARVALRLLDVELAIAAASADRVLEGGQWSPWNFERAHGAWDEYRADAARVLSVDDWTKVSMGFYGVDAVERGPGNLPTGATLDSTGLALLGEARRSLYEGANAIRRHLGTDEIRPGD
jgi:hypothetical protein